MGWGLGLAIALQLIRAHNGELQVHSEPGRGTTFEILLPRSTDDA
jgi:signal transduction histidine kinase